MSATDCTQLSLFAIEMREKLFAQSCRDNLPQFAAVWDAIFAPDHPHNFRPSIESASQVAYSPEGVAREDDRRRRRLTLGRYLARNHDLTIDAAAERGINAVTAALMAFSPAAVQEFTVLRGPDVTQAYVNRVGSGSCMAGCGQEHISAWYGRFPEKIGLVVWQETEGRALLWTADDGRQVLDRIYAGNLQLARERYADWCQRNDVVTTYESLANVPSTSDVSVTLGKDAFRDYVPYLDSLYNATEDGVFSRFGRADYHCQYTDGSYKGETCGICDANECSEDDDVRINGTLVCSDCYDRGCCYCDRCEEHCRSEGEFVVTDTGRTQTWCEDCVGNNATSCEHCGEQHESTTEVDGNDYCSSCLESCCFRCDHCETDRASECHRVDGENWCESCRQSNATSCDTCAEYYPDDSMTGGNCADCCALPKEQNEIECQAATA